MYKWMIIWKTQQNGTTIHRIEAFKTIKDAEQYERETKTGGLILEMPAIDEHVQVGCLSIRRH